MTVKKTLEFNAKNVKAFTGWLRRFVSIDNSLLLEIDEKTSTFIAKVYNEERSCVKFSSIKFNDAGLTTKVFSDPKRIKVGIFNVPRLIKIFDQFSDAEFTMTINYQDLVSEDSSIQYAGESILLKNDTLKMNVDCTSLNIFKYISDELFKDTIMATEIVGTFELTKSNLEKVNSLCILDNEHKFVDFKFVQNKVYVSGKTFEYFIEKAKDVKDACLSVFKSQYANVDIENYSVDLGDDRLLFKSKDSNTVCVLSKTSESES
jgi:hypothetical protein